MWIIYTSFGALSALLLTAPDASKMQRGTAALVPAPGEMFQLRKQDFRRFEKAWDAHNTVRRFRRFDIQLEILTWTMLMLTWTMLTMMISMVTFLE